MTTNQDAFMISEERAALVQRALDNVERTREYKAAAEAHSGKGDAFREAAFVHLCALLSLERVAREALQSSTPTFVPEGEPTKAPHPHCDQDVLHAPGTCEYCDQYPARQGARLAERVCFTGEENPDKTPCPATRRRSVDIIHAWSGNRPTRDDA